MQPQNKATGVQSITDAAHDFIDQLAACIAGQNQQILRQREQLAAIRRSVNAALCSNDPDYIRSLLLDIQKHTQP